MMAGIDMFSFVVCVCVCVCVYHFLVNLLFFRLNARVVSYLCWDNSKGIQHYYLLLLSEHRFEPLQFTTQ